MSEQPSDFEQESRDPMIRKLASFLEADLKTRSEGFCIQEEPLTADEVASHNGLLALFCFKAATLCEETMKKKLPLHFEQDKSALIEAVPMTEIGEGNLFSLWVHFLHYAVEEEIRRLKREKRLINGLVPLDGLYQEWHESIKRNKYSIKPSSKPGVGSTARGQGA